MLLPGPGRAVIVDAGIGIFGPPGGGGNSGGCPCGSSGPPPAEPLLSGSPFAAPPVNTTAVPAASTDSS
jgi:hypothetical protein